MALRAVNKLLKNNRSIVCRYSYNIKYTLTEQEAKYVNFNNEGILDVDLLNQCESTSENMTALKSVANSKTNFYVATVAEYSTNGKTKQMKDAGKMGTLGVSLIPGAKEEPSPNEHVYCYVNNKLTTLEQVETTAHELYGHGYFFSLLQSGYDFNPFHDYKSITSLGEMTPGCSIPEIISVRIDDNTKLNEQINNVVRIAKINFKSRNK